MVHPQTTSGDSDNEIFGVVSNQTVINEDRYNYNLVDRFYLSEMKRAKHCTEEQLVQLLLSVWWKLLLSLFERQPVKRPFLVYPSEIRFRRSLIYRIILV